MKVRNGFVSNSSSSSFLVVFDKMPEDVYEVHRLLFPNGAETVCPYDYEIQSHRVAEEVWNDIESQKKELPYSKEFVHDEFSNTAYTQVRKEFFAEQQQVYSLKGKERTNFSEELWKKKDARHEELQKEMSEKFLKEHDGKVILYFTYSDNDGPFYSALEHGEIFSELPHIRISYH